MTKRVELPDNGWADIKDPADLTNRDRKLVRRYLMAAQRATADKLAALGVTPEMVGKELPDGVAAKVDAATTADDLDLIDDAQAAMIVAYVADWSLGSPLPTLDTVNDLPYPIFDTLARATTVLGDGTVDTTINPDPGSPTVPSGGSAAA